MNCGRRMPHSSAEAQDAAAAAQAASSSGLRTPLEKELAYRADVIAEMARFELERSVPPPPPTGRGAVADAAAAEDHFDRVHQAWDLADSEWSAAHATLGPLPDSAALAEVEHLDRRREAAWRSRVAAMAHRDRLLAALDDVGAAQLPPGGDWWS